MQDGHVQAANEHLAANLRTLRKRKGWSQADLAAKLAVHGVQWHQQTIGRIEAGQQSVKWGEAVALAAVLETSLDRLTWPTAEANATEHVYAAGYQVRQQYEQVAVAVLQMLAATSAAQKALAQTEGSEYERVQEARRDTAARLEEYGINEAIDEGFRRWQQLTGGEDADE